MAVEDPSMPHGLKLVIEDYPYAADGILIWSAIEELVKSYVEHFYSEPNSITSDIELQSWWNEIKNKGHHDKRNEPWWPKLNTKEDLSGILTTMIWIASGQHAAINFGQYPFGGFRCWHGVLESDCNGYHELYSLNEQVSCRSRGRRKKKKKICRVADLQIEREEEEEEKGFERNRKKRDLRETGRKQI
ncbi:hypothetical protein LOK49_Contig296G00011 [Camellia lanceoleosa]|nr:hypothetical protein LOK49_Contig296G00011 [Camellia lanceoleosa]